MLTRLIKAQLVIFTLASIIGTAVMAIVYLQVPTMLDIGRMTVTVELPASGGLYRFANVTYRGVKIGTVTAMKLTRTGAEATLSLDTTPKVPADLRVEVHSLSAIGEQYIDLLPRTDSGPYLQDGAVIAQRDTAIPQPVGPLLDQASSLVDSISQTKLGQLLDETYAGFGGADYDLGSLVDSAATLSGSLATVSDQSRALVEDSAPLIDSQAQSADAIRAWARSLAGVTGQLVANDAALRRILQAGPEAVNEATKLLNQIKPTLPLLLANLTTIGQVGVTYNPSIQQLLVLMPPYIASVQTYGLVQNNPVGLPLGDFALTLSDPPACTVGFLPPSSWRSPADTSTVDTPDGLYCKLPQDSPIGVRGARNYPCMGHPGKRAPTVQLCDSPQPFEPLALRQHTLGPYPIDPNLIAQGIPPDDRVDFGDHIFGPVGGTGPDASAPSPPEYSPGSTPPENHNGETNTEPTEPAPSTPEPSSSPVVSPSAFSPTGLDISRSVAVTQYNPRTGGFLSPDGHPMRQTDLVPSARAKSWKDLLPT
ncbi:MCE family protein [Mycobacterium aquaticum]|uniref:Virulence factor Mce n=1 Tax=Mycobacterium aquaticum TaxID=1927124 RepID=A0A1X0AWU8_9MYCO|nr:MlaD family protein [Mycobacterium aquaticum]ORA34493.1 virulence factor Mce [Mycobacterium aquaticum]